MKRTEEPALADLLKLAETALNVLLGAKKEIGSHLMDKRDALVRKLDLVTREEFDAAFAVLKKQRMVQEEIRKRLEHIEKKAGLSREQTRVPKKQIRTKK